MDRVENIVSYAVQSDPGRVKYVLRKCGMNPDYARNEKDLFQMAMQAVEETPSTEEATERVLQMHPDRELFDVEPQWQPLMRTAKKTSVMGSLPESPWPYWYPASEYPQPVRSASYEGTAKSSGTFTDGILVTLLVVGLVYLVGKK